MSIFKYLIRRDKTAEVAKERLQIIISHERSQRKPPDYFPQLKEEILNVIARYIPVNREQVSVNMERIGHNTILELNVSMPEQVLDEVSES